MRNLVHLVLERVVRALTLSHSRVPLAAHDVAEVCRVPTCEGHGDCVVAVLCAPFQRSATGQGSNFGGLSSTIVIRLCRKSIRYVTHIRYALMHAMRIE